MNEDRVGLVVSADGEMINWPSIPGRWVISPGIGMLPVNCQFVQKTRISSKDHFREYQ
jgi:hypothetical protein